MLPSQQSYAKGNRNNISKPSSFYSNKIRSGSGPITKQANKKENDSLNSLTPSWLLPTPNNETNNSLGPWGAGGQHNSKSLNKGSKNNSGKSNHNNSSSSSSGGSGDVWDNITSQQQQQLYFTAVYKNTIVSSSSKPKSGSSGASVQSQPDLDVLKSLVPCQQSLIGSSSKISDGKRGNGRRNTHNHRGGRYNNSSSDNNFRANNYNMITTNTKTKTKTVTSDRGEVDISSAAISSSNMKPLTKSSKKSTISIMSSRSRVPCTITDLKSTTAEKKATSTLAYPVASTSTHTTLSNKINDDTLSSFTRPSCDSNTTTSTEINQHRHIKVESRRSASAMSMMKNQTTGNSSSSNGDVLKSKAKSNSFFPVDASSSSNVGTQSNANNNNNFRNNRAASMSMKNGNINNSRFKDRIDSNNNKNINGICQTSKIESSSLAKVSYQQASCGLKELELKSSYTTNNNQTPLGHNKNKHFNIPSSILNSNRTYSSNINNKDITNRSTTVITNIPRHDMNDKVYTDTCGKMKKTGLHHNTMPISMNAPAHVVLYNEELCHYFANEGVITQSLEDEERFMSHLGWTREDDDLGGFGGYITEEEKQEVRARCLNQYQKLGLVSPCPLSKSSSMLSNNNNNSTENYLQSTDDDNHQSQYSTLERGQESEDEVSSSSDEEELIF